MLKEHNKIEQKTKGSRDTFLERLTVFIRLPHVCRKTILSKTAHIHRQKNISCENNNNNNNKSCFPVNIQTCLKADKLLEKKSFVAKYITKYTENVLYFELSLIYVHRSESSFFSVLSI